MTIDEYRTKFNKVYEPLERARRDQMRRYAAIDAIRSKYMADYLNLIRSVKPKYS